MTYLNPVTGLSGPGGWRRCGDHMRIALRPRPSGAAVLFGALATALALAGCGTQHSGGAGSGSGTTSAAATTSAPAAPTSSATATGQGSGGAATPAGGPVPTGMAATSVTFVSPDEAFVLGTAPCSHTPCTSIVRTLNRGASWRGLPAPVGAARPARERPGVGRVGHQVRHAVARLRVRHRAVGDHRRRRAVGQGFFSRGIDPVARGHRRPGPGADRALLLAERVRDRDPDAPAGGRRRVAVGHPAARQRLGGGPDRHAGPRRRDPRRHLRDRDRQRRPQHPGARHAVHHPGGRVRDVGRGDRP